jgi:FMN-dependent NADH-azoreductase
VHGKRIVLAVSRGGRYEGTPAQAVEHQESWLKGVFAFMGVKDVEVIRAEGVAYGPEARAASLKAALDEAKALQAA